MNVVIIFVYFISFGTLLKMVTKIESYMGLIAIA